MLRRIPSASPLSEGPDQGHAAEEATQEAAAVWGLPDFVYRQSVVQLRGGIRELGDGIVIVGDTAMVLQVKRRTVPSGRTDRESSWILKNSEQALSQAAGTIRRLRREPAMLRSLRGRSIEIAGSDYRWISIVIVDHDEPPRDVVVPLTAEQPAVVMLRRDWEFLFEQLKSTSAVVGYCGRVAGEAHALGLEPTRYYELALADRDAQNEEIDPRLVVRGQPIISSPTLPLAPAAFADADAHAMVRSVFEDIALTRLTKATEEQMLQVLAELDRLPVSSRAVVGEFLIDAIGEAITSTDERTVWRYRSLRGNQGQAHLAYGACNKPLDEEIQRAFELWVQLRHHEVVTVTGDIENLTTVGVLLTPRDDKERPWDTTVCAVKGDLGYSARDIELLRELWPRPEEMPTAP